MTETTPQNVLLRRLAVATALVSLLPIGMGSLVTTLGAGMAFPDWPTSDGQGMLSYPWHLSVGDKFVEHGHRLAGMLIGFFAIGLCLVAWKSPTSRSVRLACSAALAGVVVQGLLGGMRVLLDARVMAYGHSVFGCCVFVGLWLVVLMTSHSWNDLPIDNTTSNSSLRTASVLLPVITLTQYVLGGAVRHFGAMLDFHVLGACVVALATAIISVMSYSAGSADVKKFSRFVVWAVLVQVVVGIATWITKYGVPSVGLVAVQHSFWQVLSRTAHTVAGMGIVATSVAWAFVVQKSTASHVCESRQVVLQ